jgi:hypothetical protein
MVIPKLPKLEPWVRFPSPAPLFVVWRVAELHVSNSAMYPVRFGIGVLPVPIALRRVPFLKAIEFVRHRTLSYLSLRQEAVAITHISVKFNIDQCWARGVQTRVFGTARRGGRGITGRRCWPHGRRFREEDRTVRPSRVLPSRNRCWCSRRTM